MSLALVQPYDSTSPSTHSPHVDATPSHAELVDAVLGSRDQGVLACDAEGILLAANDRLLMMHGLPAELCQAGRHYLDIVLFVAQRGDFGPGDPEAIAQERWDIASSNRGLTRYSLFGPTGRCIDVTSRPIPGGGFINSHTDVTEARAAHAAFEISDDSFRLFAEESPDVVQFNTIDGTRRYVSPAAERVLGGRPEDMIGHKAIELVHPDDRQALDEAHIAMKNGVPGLSLCYRYRRPDGSWQWLEATARTCFDRGRDPDSYVVVLRDATERKASEAKIAAALQRMEQMATTDELTGLANRRHFEAKAEVQWRRCVQINSPLAVLLLEVDAFGRLNDRYGHRAGDTCLRSISAGLHIITRRPHDVAARFGEDQFVVLLPDTDQPTALHLATRVRLSIQQMAIPNADSLHGVVTVSAGVAATYATSGIGYPGFAALLSAADRALSQAKNAGRNQAAAASEAFR